MQQGPARLVDGEERPILGVFRHDSPALGYSLPIEGQHGPGGRLDRLVEQQPTVVGLYDTRIHRAFRSERLGGGPFAGSEARRLHPVVVAVVPAPGEQRSPIDREQLRGDIRDGIVIGDSGRFRPPPLAAKTPDDLVVLAVVGGPDDQPAAVFENQGSRCHLTAGSLRGHELGLAPPPMEPLRCPDLEAPETRSQRPRRVPPGNRPESGEIGCPLSVAPGTCGTGRSWIVPLALLDQQELSAVGRRYDDPPLANRRGWARGRESTPPARPRPPPRPHRDVRFGGCPAPSRHRAHRPPGGLEDTCRGRGGDQHRHAQQGDDLHSTLHNSLHPSIRGCCGRLSPALGPAFYYDWPRFSQQPTLRSIPLLLRGLTRSSTSSTKARSLERASPWSPFRWTRRARRPRSSRTSRSPLA